VQEPLVGLETGEFEFVGHAKHVEEALAPTTAEYVAVPQSVHAALPGLVLCLPATHDVHEPASPVLPGGQSNTHAAKAVLPAGETPPAPHEVQALKTVAPVAPDHVPATQSVQAALPALVLYLPAMHDVHEPTGPVLPGGQSNTHAAKAVLAAGDTPPAPHAVHALVPAVAEKVPDTQSVHAALPLLVLDLPATHAVHVPPSAPVYPALQVQAELGLGGFELAEQVTQFVAPTVVEYEFAGHCMQAVPPTMGMYVPTVQLVHEPSPAQTTHGLYCPA